MRQLAAGLRYLNVASLFAISSRIEAAGIDPSTEIDSEFRSTSKRRSTDTISGAFSVAAMRRAEIAEADIAAYTSQGDVFPGQDNLTLEHIIGQKYISFWMFQSIEAYNDQRRTGIPQMNDPGGTPLRLPYPPSEVNRNPNTPKDINDATIYERNVWWAEP